MKLLQEKLIEIQNSEKIIVEPIYFLQGIPHAIEKCYARETVAKKILKIAKSLPNGLKLKIYDAWRPFEVQKYLYEQYKEQIARDNQDLKESKIDELVKIFVSEPIRDIGIAPLHCTGGAIDLTITHENGTELNMGTGFDDFSESAHTNHYINEEIKKNREFLYNLMKEEGFVNLNSEWWHYDYGDKHWAKQTGNKIVYKGIFEIENAPL